MTKERKTKMIYSDRRPYEVVRVIGPARQGYPPAADDFWAERKKKMKYKVSHRPITIHHRSTKGTTLDAVLSEAKALTEDEILRRMDSALEDYSTTSEGGGFFDTYEDALAAAKSFADLNRFYADQTQTEYRVVCEAAFIDEDDGEVIVGSTDVIAFRNVSYIVRRVTY